MEEFAINFINEHGYLIYPLVLVWTFFEGETIVLVVSALAATSAPFINLPLLGACATAGTMAGDQLFYYLGRFYGTPFLASRPKLAAKAERGFALLRKGEVPFILSYRFIYGVRNVSPFVVGVGGIPPVRFFFLNLTASSLWAFTFTAGGYFLGKVLEQWLEEYKMHMIAAVILLIGMIYLFNRSKGNASPSA
ncbi:DedA family protein [Candidatus Magnetaquicoccus inordinatus]|uniref:DedA family protein n=1 Tax=Candidatus Magnetaquicoccus inordinatus TaxID=2496818 RepID=UPI00102B3426|nr:DedA family protein [Candidatus Magnetaquicoccus inordinatus]